MRFLVRRRQRELEFFCSLSRGEQACNDCAVVLIIAELRGRLDRNGEGPLFAASGVSARLLSFSEMLIIFFGAFCSFLHSSSLSMLLVLGVFFELPPVKNSKFRCGNRLLPGDQ